MRNGRARAIVATVAILRVGIGVAFAAAPRRLGGDAPLMTRSFAVREVVLGVAGLAAVARTRDPSNVRRWAGLGAMVDVGDLWAALVAMRTQASLGAAPALMATTGLALELWAWHAATPPPPIRDGTTTGFETP